MNIALAGSSVQQFIFPCEVRNATLKNRLLENKMNNGTRAHVRCPEAPLSQDQVHMQFIMCVHTDVHCSPSLCRQCSSYSGTNVLCEDSCCKPHVAPRLLLLSRPNPYRLRFKHPQSRCFQREWFYGGGLSFKTPMGCIFPHSFMFISSGVCK